MDETTSSASLPASALPITTVIVALTNSQANGKRCHKAFRDRFLRSWPYHTLSGGLATARSGCACSRRRSERQKQQLSRRPTRFHIPVGLGGFGQRILAIDAEFEFPFRDPAE
jgi:hypothetical protein